MNRNADPGKQPGSLWRWERTRVAVVALFALLAFALAFRGPLWRSAYPYLPAKIQAIPYRLGARLAGSHSTPVPLPTVRVAEALDPLPLASPGSELTDSGAALEPSTHSLPPLPTDVPSVSDPTPFFGVPWPTGAATPVADVGRAQPSPTAALPPAADLGELRHMYQTWNNCGPATLCMALSHYGDVIGQAEAARFLKPDPDDKNVSPDELAGLARGRGFEAPVRVGGDVALLKALLAADVAVIVETWFVPEPHDEMGHYRVLTGYSDAEATFFAADSYNGPKIRLAYDDFDQLWRVFNRLYVPIYPPERAADVSRILGVASEDRRMWEGALARAEVEVAANEDAFGWFNIGSSLQAVGDSAGAARAFDRARAIGLPWRMLWYQFAPFEAYAAEGRWDDVKALADANLKNAPNLEESLYWRGRALAATGDEAGARAAWEKALHFNPNFSRAKEALAGSR